MIRDRHDVAEALDRPVTWRYGWLMLLERQALANVRELRIYACSDGAAYLLNQGIIR